MAKPKWNPVEKDKDVNGVSWYLREACGVSEDDLENWVVHTYKELKNKWNKKIEPFVAATKEKVSELEQYLDNLECRDADEINEMVEKYSLVEGVSLGFKINRYAFGQCS